MSDDHTETIEIEDIAHGGDGVGHRADGRVVFVSRVLPGERVRVRSVEEKDSFVRAELVEVLEASEARVEPDCPHFERCGGCQFWHTGYEDELEMKARASREAIERISGVGRLPEPTVIGSPEDRRYRNRANFHRRRRSEAEGGGEGWGIGFFARGSHDLVEVADCPITTEQVCQARREVEPGLRDVGDCDMLVESADADSAVVTVYADGLDSPPRSLWEFVDQLEEVPSIRGIRVLGGERSWESGDTSVDGDQVMARMPVGSLRMPAGLFRQSNQAVNDLLVETVAEAVEAQGGGTVLELFAGAGNLSFAMREHVDALLGLEFDETAVEMGNAIAQFGGVETFMFREADLAEGFLGALEPGEEAIFEQIVMDPARGGAPDVSRELAGLPEETSVGSITYVSCDPAAFGRDLETLAAGGWGVVEWTILDMFPRTAHVEVVATLER